ncbi:MAG: hypothetical protein AB7V25_13090 [Mangrovibacterium sp.]
MKCTKEVHLSAQTGTKSGSHEKEGVKVNEPNDASGDEKGRTCCLQGEL